MLSLFACGCLLAQTHEWSFGIGGASGGEFSREVAVDGDGNVIMVGSFQRTVDFNPGPGTATLVAGSGGTLAVDGYVAKYDSSGNYLWAFKLGSSADQHDHTYGLDVDTAGNIYVVGTYQLTVDFNPGPGVFNMTPVGGFDAFVCKYDPSGNFLWAFSFGGPGGWPTGYDAGWGVKVTDDGHLYITGQFVGTVDFDPGAGTTSLTSSSGYDAYVAKYTTAGALVWANRWGSTGDDWGLDVSETPGGDVLVTGSFTGTTDFNPGAGVANLTALGSSDGYLASFTSAGTFNWVRHIGSTGSEEGLSVVANDSGEVFVTGYFGGTLNVGSATFISAGAEDLFLLKYSVAGTYLGGFSAGSVDGDQGIELKVAANQGVYLTGYYSNTLDADPGAGTVPLSSAGSNDIFLCSYDRNLNYQNSLSIGGAGFDRGQGLFVVRGSPELIYLTGTFDNTVDFDPGPGASTFTPTLTDLFLAKYSQCTAPFIDPNLDTLVACGGDSVALSVLTSSLNGAGGWVWKDGGCAGTTIGTGPSLMVAASTSRYYHLTAAGACAETCDSVYVNLLVDSSDTLATAACDSFFWSESGITYTATGSYSVSYSSVAGCDSILVLDLTLLASSGSSVSVSACNNYSWPLSGLNYSTSGTYFATITNAAGCDSLVTLSLTIQNVTNAVVLSGDSLSAVQAGASYQWLNCDSGFTPIPGATNQLFLPTASGNYAVVVTLGACVDTSACESVIILTAGEEVSSSGWTVFPNPAGDHTQVELMGGPASGRSELIDINGKTQATIMFHGTNQFSLFTEHLPSGVYMLRITLNNGKTMSRKWVKL